VAVLIPAALALLAAPAYADTPASWPDVEPISMLHAVLLLGGVPVLLFVLIGVAVYVPSMVRGEREAGSDRWQGGGNWFGGPREGVEATDKVDPAAIEGLDESERGGASVRW
jgi:hypothetical protein